MNDSMTILKKLLKQINKYLPLLIISVIMAAVSVVLQMYIPILFGKAIDGIIEAGKIDYVSIEGYLKKILVLLILSALSTWLMNLINNKVTYGVVEDIRSKAIRQIQVLPLSYLDAHSSGDIVQRVIGDADQLSDGLLLGFNQLFSGIITIFVTLYFMFSKNTMITLIVIALTPVSFIVSKFIASRSYEMFKRTNEARGKQTSLINEMIGNEKIVKAFGYEERASKKFEQINDELRQASQSATFFSSLTNPSTRAVNNVIYALVALVGALKILSASLSVGDLSVLLSYANQYMKPFNDISSVITELQNSLACASRVFELIEAKPQSADPEDQLIVKDGEIDIEHVYFSYVKGKRLIEDFSFHADPGMTIAIVGPTGCGKTTFINLLMRFYDVDKGSIRVDQTDINTVSRESLRRNYGMVLQETWLKNASVRENIAFGKPDATDEEIKDAAKRSHCWEFIRRMPQGLDTIINDDSLSQGQKQLLCICRVMLCMPPMLILDEATSSIDTRTEIYIQRAFNALMEGRTSFIVAHRLSTIRNADRIIVMNEGKILEQGTHDSLMELNGIYSNLYNSQFAKVE
ncbi:MAG: ABC transporter ATP-binding protein [Erysipelotrichaceae bacterium]|nr:ABC transporter ATP-binding protein [Erysipelotrichaceae bacterium]